MSAGQVRCPVCGRLLWLYHASRHHRSKECARNVERDEKFATNRRIIEGSVSS